MATRTVRCEKCEGIGKIFFNNICPQCNGRGELTIVVDDPPKPKKEKKCSSCKGSGQVQCWGSGRQWTECPECLGTGTR